MHAYSQKPTQYAALHIRILQSTGTLAWGRQRSVATLKAAHFCRHVCVLQSTGASGMVHGTAKTGSVKQPYMVLDARTFLRYLGPLISILLAG